MKSIFAIAFLGLMSTPTFASHNIMCTFEADVTEVKSLARLNGDAVFRRTGGPSDYEQVVKIEIKSVLADNSGPNQCARAGTVFELHVPQSEVGAYTTGTSLTLDYHNVGDHTGSRITWQVRN